MISQKLIAAIKLGSEPAYKIAQKAGVDSTVLSKLLCGICRVKPDDPRVISVGRVLGIPAKECFEEKNECQI